MWDFLLEKVDFLLPAMLYSLLEGSFFQILGVIQIESFTKKDCFGGVMSINTVDGWNPAPPRMMIIPLFIGF